MPRGTERCVVLLGASCLSNRPVAAKFYRNEADFLHEREFYLGAEVRGFLGCVGWIDAVFFLGCVGLD